MSSLATKAATSSLPSVPAQIGDLRAIARRALKRMYLPDRGMFAFCLRRGRNGDVLEGVSPRYSAIALIGLAEEDESVASDVLGGADIQTLCSRLLDDVHQVENVGDVALTLWAALALRHSEAGKAHDQLRELRPWECACPTVELAWALTAFSISETLASSETFASAEALAPDPAFLDSAPASQVARRLLGSFLPASELFPHWPSDAGASWIRDHVCCYADLVYPIQALSHYYRCSGDEEAITVAKRCAERMCSLQGEAGQWWWHYDVRSGRVLEGYPVYAIHQDAMGPMALLDLQEASGVGHGEAIQRSLDWLTDPPELDATLIDPEAGVVWRKAARHEPGKLVRSVQAIASRAHPALRVPGLDSLFRPGFVDWESRPYHFGWLLYAWAPRRFAS